MIWFRENNFTMLAIDPRWNPTDEDVKIKNLELDFIFSYLSSIPILIIGCFRQIDVEGIT